MRNQLVRFSVLFCGLWASPNARCEGLAYDHSYSKWAQILTQVVRVDGLDARVNIGQVRAQHLSQLESLLADFSETSETEFESWSPQQKQAFWINGFNAGVMLLVAQSPRVASAEDLVVPRTFWNPFRNPWRHRFVTVFKKTWSLKQIEDRLREDVRDPRYFSVLWRASTSSPMLRNEPYRPETLEVQLENAVRLFLRDSRKNRFENGIFYLSETLKWHRDLIESQGRPLSAYVSLKMARTPEEEGRMLKGEHSVEFLTYDWTLDVEN